MTTARTFPQGLADGTAITSGNSSTGGQSGMTIGLGTGATLVADTGVAVPSCQGSGETWLFTSGSTGSFAEYVVSEATHSAERTAHQWNGAGLPAGVDRIIDIRNASGTACRLSVNSSGIPYVEDTTGIIATGTGIALTPGNWYRFELAITVSAGSASVVWGVYDDNDASPITGHSGSLTGKNTGAATVTLVRHVSSANTTSGWTKNVGAFAHASQATLIGPLGPAVMTASCSDTAHATETLTQQRTASVTASDTAHATDVAMPAMGRHVTASDTAAATDSAVKTLLAHTRAVADAAHATETLTFSAALTRGPPDTAAATDTATKAGAFTRAAADTAAATDGTGGGTSDRYLGVYGDTYGSLGGATLVTVSVVEDVLIRDTDQQQFVEYTLTTADTAAAVDTAAGTFRSSTVTASDTAHATDVAVGSSRPGSVTTADTAHATDSAVGSPIILATPALDSAPAVDSGSISGAVLHAAAVDTAAATDTATPGVVMGRSCSDTAHATDAPASSFRLGSATAADTAGASDAATRATSGARVVADSSPATDTTAGVAGARSVSAHDVGLGGFDSTSTNTALGVFMADPAPAHETAPFTASIGVFASDSAPATDMTSLPATATAWRVRAGRPTTTWQAGPVSTPNLRLILANS